MSGFLFSSLFSYLITDYISMDSWMFISYFIYSAAPIIFWFSKFLLKIFNIRFHPLGSKWKVGSERLSDLQKDVHSELHPIMQLIGIAHCLATGNLRSSGEIGQ